ncbi:uncharacterized protein BJ212DRAFT_1303553 [Suillus subaureus]|uniref:Uncharacterized protein n=1 Tax=Suillus subaureus TaxID=48587 RepID=A0A9P7DVQ7_9AGAM|nr:uncharacterized protein BJ212DRAFT_1304320 [Suillus subaureus]XP_041188016.1 uncharacterized protein BJ212DRAFT_1303553 [Suillus subaureus]KAG1804444.1 hypothetical protein BJ212DRAFT_1304320 [Suillus subaureus]KAG1807347.1 hypothetical protein BJ212DRAFT_1303553 [Suillus subaureus]
MQNLRATNRKTECRLQMVQGTRYVADLEIVQTHLPSQAERVTDPQTNVAADSDAESKFPATFKILDHRDLPVLQRAKAELIVRHGKNNLDMFICAHVASMIALISLYIDPELRFGQMKCSKLVAKAVRRGVDHA